MEWNVSVNMVKIIEMPFLSKKVLFFAMLQKDFRR